MIARPHPILIALILVAGTTAHARDPLGMFGAWGAFRDRAPARCYAIAEPETHDRKGDHRPFASIARWPGRGGGPELHIRLRKIRKPQTPVELAIGAETVRLVAGPADAWSPDSRADARVVRLMRSGEWMRVTARAADGKRFSDVYSLKGAATAIDAALVACARRR